MAWVQGESGSRSSHWRGRDQAAWAGAGGSRPSPQSFGSWAAPAPALASCPGPPTTVCYAVASCQPPREEAAAGLEDMSIQQPILPHRPGTAWVEPAGRCTRGLQPTWAAQGRAGWAKGRRQGLDLTGLERSRIPVDSFPVCEWRQRCPFPGFRERAAYRARQAPACTDRSWLGSQVDRTGLQTAEACPPTPKAAPCPLSRLGMHS